MNTDQTWAEEMFNAVEATPEACFEFDMSEDGRRYHKVTGTTMTVNLGFWGELTNTQQGQLNERFPAAEGENA